jgi:hypothetical protein
MDVESAPGEIVKRNSLLARAKASKGLYAAFVLTAAVGAIALMVVPAELMSEAPTQTELNLETTFSTLVRLILLLSTATHCILNVATKKKSPARIIRQRVGHLANTICLLCSRARGGLP